MSDINKEMALKDNNQNINGVKARTFHTINKSLGSSFEPAGETPRTIYSVYNFNNCVRGEGQTIAIVIAFHYPTALNDFNVFSNQFDLPSESSTNPLAVTNKHFQVVYATGTEPALDEGWALEAALDIEWAHAMAPLAKIVLVEAASNLYVDLFQAVDIASSIPGVSVISMSWGGGEWANETNYDVHLKKPGVSYVAASGDVGGQCNYPSTSPYVLSVGGTTINRNNFGWFISETAWVAGGGGPSLFESIPSYQKKMKCVLEKTDLYRGTPDICFDGDMVSGVSVYTSTPFYGILGWLILGGTSVSAPCWAGIIACINSRLSKPMGNRCQELLYKAAGETQYTNQYCCFRDITSGTAGEYTATLAWDFITGLGSPNIDRLIKYFALRER